MNNSAFARAAIEYAYANDVPVIASAADEESFHHNAPATNRHTITVNSVTRSVELAGLALTPQSYLFLNGCTNYGGNMAVAISSSSCSSEATGKASGIAGLLISAALDRVEKGMLTPRRTDAAGHVHPLSANEIGQLLTMTADDIDFSADRTNDSNYSAAVASGLIAITAGLIFGFHARWRRRLMEGPHRDAGVVVRADRIYHYGRCFVAALIAAVAVTGVGYGIFEIAAPDIAAGGGADVVQAKGISEVLSYAVLAVGALMIFVRSWNAVVRVDLGAVTTRRKT